MSLMTGYCLSLSEQLDHRDAYRLYSFLLEQLPANLAQQLHDSPAHPLSQYADGANWVISVMGSRAGDALMPAILSMKTIGLAGGRRQLTVCGCSRRSIENVEELLYASAPSIRTLQFRAPTAFKSRGSYQLLPTQHLLLQSLTRRWNQVFADECPIEDEGEGLDALEAGLIYRALELRSQTFRLKDGSVPAVIGSIEIENRLQGFHSCLLNALLTFGTYSGIGIKTGLGMGGITLTGHVSTEEHIRKTGPLSI